MLTVRAEYQTIVYQYHRGQICGVDCPEDRPKLKSLEKAGLGSVQIRDPGGRYADYLPTNNFAYECGRNTRVDDSLPAYCRGYL